MESYQSFVRGKCGFYRSSTHMMSPSSTVSGVRHICLIQIDFRPYSLPQCFKEQHLQQIILILKRNFISRSLVSTLKRCLSPFVYFVSGSFSSLTLLLVELLVHFVCFSVKISRLALPYYRFRSST